MVCVPVQCPYYQSAEVMKAGKQANGLRRKAQLKTSDIITLYDPRSQDRELLRWRLERVLRRVRSGPLRIACMTSFTLAFSNAHCIAICRQVRETLEGVDRERPQRQQLQVQTRQQQAQARQQ